MKDTVRLNFEFPREDYPYLKMLCAYKRMSLKALATELLLKEIEEYEDLYFAKKADERLDELEKEDLVTFEEASILAGWENDKNISTSLQQKVSERSGKNTRKRSKTNKRNSRKTRSKS